MTVSGVDEDNGQASRGRVVACVEAIGEVEVEADSESESDGSLCWGERDTSP